MMTLCEQLSNLSEVVHQHGSIYKAPTSKYKLSSINHPDTKTVRKLDHVVVNKDGKGSGLMVYHGPLKQDKDYHYVAASGRAASPSNPHHLVHKSQIFRVSDEA